MSRMMIVVEFEVKPEHRNAVYRADEEITPQLSRAEDGCQQFDVLLPQERCRAACFLVEAWRDQAGARRAREGAADGAEPAKPIGPWLVSRKATRCIAD